MLPSLYAANPRPALIKAALPEPVSEDARLLASVKGQKLGTRLRAYLHLGGPGWLQSALTLGGASLTGSLYLGVLTGYSALWLQPLAMLLGIIMLAALGYVTVSTGLSPFVAVKTYINPILAWGWALASLIASMVWALPQYALANGVLQQNLLPGVLGPDSALGERSSTVVVSVGILAVATVIAWNYGSEKVGVRIYEVVLKVMVAAIVLAFMAVVLRLMLVPPGLDVIALLKGFVPDLRLITRPAPGFDPLLVTLEPEARAFWSRLIVSKQQDVMAAAFASAVGINMTFLFGYSLLSRRWGREFRGFMKFDLATGMLIPFVLATSGIVVAASSQFHAVPAPGFSQPVGAETSAPPVSDRQAAEYRTLLTERLSIEGGAAPGSLDEAALDRRIDRMSSADRTMAAVLVNRVASDLANALRPVSGEFFSHIVFGFGVLAMTVSTITLMMVISGMVVCELLGKPHSGWPFRLGSLLAATGALGPFFWSQAYFWLAVPTSIVGLMLLPIAYATFVLMMNRRSLLGDDMPIGWRRAAWNGLMLSSLAVVVATSLYMIRKQTGAIGFVVLVLFLAAVLGAEVYRWFRPTARAAAGNVF